MNLTFDQAAQIATVAGFVIAVISFGSLAFSAYRYVQVRNTDQKQRRFENYHALLEIALGGKKNDSIYVDKQAAAIFELRGYREYRELTIRILSRLKEKCLNSGETETPAVRTIIEETSLTLESLNKCRAWLSVNAQIKKNLDCKN